MKFIFILQNTSFKYRIELTRDAGIRLNQRPRDVTVRNLAGYDGQLSVEIFKGIWARDASEVARTAYERAASLLTQAGKEVQ
jgi:hypothetical protein